MTDYACSLDKGGLFFFGGSVRRFCQEREAGL